MRFATFLLFALFAPQAKAQTDSERLHKLFADYHENQLKNSPEAATSLGRNEYNHLWTDWSPAAREARHAQAEKYLRDLDAFANAKLDAQDRLSRDLLRYQIRQALDLQPLRVFLMPLSQMGGFHSSVFQTIDQMPTRTVKDYENIIARINALPVYIDQHIANFQEAIRLGLTQPRIVVDLTSKQVAAQMEPSPAESPLLAAFRRFPANIGKTDQERLRSQAEAGYIKSFRPAWRKLLTFYNEAYAPKARQSTSMGDLPNGKNYYALSVRSYTTTSMTPQEIHELGLKEVKRIEAEMEKIAAQTDFHGTLNEFERKLQSSPEFLFHSKEEMLVYCRNAAMIAEPELPRLFKRLPRMPFGIRAIPEDQEASTASHYNGPATDGTRAGFVYINCYEPEKQVKYNKEALILHEGVPGHHLQIALQREIEGLPEFRKSSGFGAFSEGWGLYAESLGSELGLYRNPYSLFGRLSSERFRAARLVIDTGLHAMGWSRAQAIDYFHTHAAGMSVAEIDRYIAWPGQALSYKMGELKISGLRRLAEQKLGAKFDVREFHDVVLRNGALPLDMLEQQVMEYIGR
jgi:Uncharacterized protein conserved in bacteria